MASPAAPNTHTDTLGNQFSTPTHVLRRVAATLVNNCVFTSPMNINRKLDPQWRSGSTERGDTIHLRLPQRFVSVVGRDMTGMESEIEEPTVPVTIDTQRNILLKWDSVTSVFFVRDVKQREYNQMTAQLGNDVDYDGLSKLVPLFSRSVGKPGINPGEDAAKYDSAGTYLDAMAMLESVSIPKPYVALLTPRQHASIVKDNLDLFNPQRRIAANFRTGQFAGETLQFGISRWYSTQNLPAHRVGALGGTPALRGAVAEGATSVNIDGWTASRADVLRVGDVLEYGEVEEVNPMNRDQAQHPFFSRVVAPSGGGTTYSATAAGRTDGVNVYPAFRGPAGGVKTRNQNCSALPADNALVKVFGHATTYANRSFKSALVYNPDAVVLATAALPVPRGLWIAERVTSPKVGVSLRLQKDHNVLTDQSPTRMDTLYGFAFVRDLGLRVASK